MESSKSIADDEPVDALGNPLSGEADTDAGSPNGDDDGSPDGDDESSPSGDERLTFDEWLADAEAIATGDRSTTPDDGTVASVAEPPAGQNMSDIMAELLAAAESSADESHSDADTDETSGDIDIDIDIDIDDIDDIDADTEIETDIDDSIVDADTDTDDPNVDADVDDRDEDLAAAAATVDLDALADDEPDSTNADDTASHAEETVPDAEETASHAEETVPDADDTVPDAEHEVSESDDERSHAEEPAADTEEPATDAEEPATDTEEPAADSAAQPAPPTFPVRATTEIKTSESAIAMPNQRRARSRPPVGLLIVGALVGGYALLALAWTLDTLGHRGEAMRGVQIGETEVGGADRELLTTIINSQGAAATDRPLEVRVGATTVETNPVALGLKPDTETMIEDALAAKRGGFLPFRPFIWLRDLGDTVPVEPSYTVDADTAARATRELIEPELAEPVEPTLGLEGNELVVNQGAPGITVESEEIVNLLADEVAAGEPYRLQLTPIEFAPELDNRSITELVGTVNRHTTRPISVRVLDDQAEVSPRTLKSWIRMSVADGDPSWFIDEQQALADLEPLFPTLGSEDGAAKFTVVDGDPVILPASESVICCGDGSADALRQIIKRPIPPTTIEQDEDGNEVEVETLREVALTPIITDDGDVAELESLGIIEQISTFTTKHACCQNRVQNIQRFADLMQGVIVRPGEELSLNDHVGRRTIEKGFVADGAIALGNFEKQVGGGISQYATTFFNAAFFAGIEFLEYQSHSIYISRYPRGREATISWRRPDLKVRNTTDYGILVWNEYTPTSITVTFYSTKHLEVEALDRRRSSDRKCRIDITPRLITFPDGTQEEDSVFASYRPGEGLDCNGNSTTPEEEEEEPPPGENVSPPPPEQQPPPPPGEGEILPPGG